MTFVGNLEKQSVHHVLHCSGESVVDMYTTNNHTASAKGRDLTRQWTANNDLGSSERECTIENVIHLFVVIFLDVLHLFALYHHLLHPGIREGASLGA